MTRLGIGTYSLAWAIGVPQSPPPVPMDTMRFLNAAASCGVKLVQIADNLPLHRLSRAEFTEVKREAESLGIQIEVGTRGIQPDHLRTYLALAQEVGSSLLRVVVDTAEHHPAPDEVVALLKPSMPLFEQANVCLAIENHDRFKAQTLVEIMRQLDSPAAGICLDTVNSFGALEGPDVVIATLGPYVVNLHVKDFEIRRVSHNMGFILEGTPAGKGMLNIPKVLDTLNSQGRDFNAILELWPPPEATIEATIATEAAWVAESIDYLRTIIKE